jgi:hypothetical protein
MDWIRLGGGEISHSSKSFVAYSERLIQEFLLNHSFAASQDVELDSDQILTSSEQA